MNWHRRKYTHQATMSSPKCDQDNMHANLLIEKIFHQFDPNVSKEKKKKPRYIYIYTPFIQTIVRRNVSFHKSMLVFADIYTN